MHTLYPSRKLVTSGFTPANTQKPYTRAP
jgi:hypothetical protein